MLLNAIGLALARRRTGVVVVGVVVFYLSTQILFQPHLLDFWSPADLAAEWLMYLFELAGLAVAMATAYAMAQAAARSLGLGPGLRLLWGGLALYIGAALFGLAVAWFRRRFDSSPEIGLALIGAIRWTIVALYLVAMQMLWHRVRKMDAEALAAADDADVLLRERQQLRLQLLKAQIEPHFLFNTLANVRRLYRTDLGRGEQMMASLKRYLQAALPGVRRDDASLADELALVRAYLDLIAVRMGDRLVYDVRDDSGMGSHAFPSMLVLTLVENAIKHGIEPSLKGGRVAVRAGLESERLVVEVDDDGVGLGAAQSGGSGVGLANIRSQLRARYGNGARLDIVGCTPGVVATIRIDWEALR